MMILSQHHMERVHQSIGKESIYETRGLIAIGR